MSITAGSLAKDIYKEFHPNAYHPLVTEVYSNFTNRSGRLSNIPSAMDIGGVVNIGAQYFIKDFLLGEMNTSFFNLPKQEALDTHARIITSMLGKECNTSRLADLHDLGYLPLEIKSIPEGTIVPYGVPSITVRSTLKGFQWLTNAIETVMSCEIWGIQTTATSATAYHKTFLRYAKETGLDEAFVPFQGHDFSMRSMFGRQAAYMSGFGHLASGLVGTDTIGSVLFAEKYYNANVDKELVGCSVDATEHSVTCSWMAEGEEEFIKYLMSTASTSGILSVVADTWDFWNLVTVILPKLKDKIMSRDGTVVIRPDSGDPVDILCGTGSNPNLIHTQEVKTIEKNPEYFGLIECLWHIFGGTINGKGFKVLDEHIGAIYGDSITLERQELILSRLKAKGFASKVVLGVGGYTYQYVTRDTHGSAVKATSIVKNGEREAIFKAPKTDTSKKSAKGLLWVGKVNNEIILIDDVSETLESCGSNMLETIFLDGKLIKETSLSEIRQKIKEQIID